MARLFSITLAFPKLVHNSNILAQIKNMHYRAKLQVVLKLLPQTFLSLATLSFQNLSSTLAQWTWIGPCCPPLMKIFLLLKECNNQGSVEKQHNKFGNFFVLFLGNEGQNYILQKKIMPECYFQVRVSLYAKIWQLNNFKVGKFIRSALLPLTPLIFCSLLKNTV